MDRSEELAQKVVEDTLTVFGIGSDVFSASFIGYLKERIAQGIRDEVRWSMHEKFTVLDNGTKFSCPKCGGTWALGDLYNPAGVALCPECNTLEMAEDKAKKTKPSPSTPFKATSHALSLLRGRVATLELRMEEVQKELEEKRNAEIQTHQERLHSNEVALEEKYRKLESVVSSAIEALYSLNRYKPRLPSQAIDTIWNARHELEGAIAVTKNVCFHCGFEDFTPLGTKCPRCGKSTGGDQ